MDSRGSVGTEFRTPYALFTILGVKDFDITILTESLGPIS